MASLSDILDRISGFTTLNARVSDLTREVIAIRAILLDHERQLAEIKGHNKALLQIQSQLSRNSKAK